MISTDWNAKNDDGSTKWNVYLCTACSEAGVDHTIEDRNAGLSDATCQWGKGIPMTKQVCTGCGIERGPFVSTEYTGDGW